MTRLRVKHFGPVREGLLQNDGWIEFRKVTVFVGNQGTGKSTVAKLFSTFSWIEKALVRGDYDKKWFERKNRLRNQFLNYHRLENYFEHNSIDQAEIEYQGDAYTIIYSSGQLTISQNLQSAYGLPQIMYVPAERNFISYVRNPKALKLSSDSLKEFLTEFDNAKTNMKGPIPLPINNVELEYDKLNDNLNIKGADYRLRLADASSGYQSLVPLFLVSAYLSKNILDIEKSDTESMSTEEVQRFKRGVESIFSNNSLTDEQKRVALSVLSSRFNKTSFVNIVEEPEQNLFPSSQWHLLSNLLEFNNRSKENRLLMTSHSPYIVSFLGVVVQAQRLIGLIETSKRPNVYREKLAKIVSPNSLVSGEDLVIYQFDNDSGEISALPTFAGLPSDANYLNQFLIEGNHLFDALLELDEEIRSELL